MLSETNIDGSCRVPENYTETFDTSFRAITHTNQHSTITKKNFCVLLRRQLFIIRGAEGENSDKFNSNLFGYR